MFRDQELFDKQKQEIDKLINLNKEDYIDLYLGNMAHFTLIPYLPYAWLNKENPVLVPFKTAGNLSIIGLMNLGCSFFPGRHKFILFYRGGIF